MQPTNTVIPGKEVRVYAVDLNQPNCRPLYFYADSEGRTVTHWKLSWWERLRVLWSGSVWCALQLIDYKLPGMRLTAVKPEVGEDGLLRIEN